MRLLFRPTLVQHIKLQKIVESLRIEKKKNIIEVLCSRM